MIYLDVPGDALTLYAILDTPEDAERKCRAWLRDPANLDCVERKRRRHAGTDGYRTPA